MQNVMVSFKLPEEKHLELLELKRAGLAFSISEIIRNGLRSEVKRLKEEQVNDNLQS